MPLDALSQKERQLLDGLQKGLALEPHPFGLLGEQLGMGEEEILSATAALIDSGLIRRIGGIFDSAALGYVSTLAAARVKDHHIDQVAAIISAEPGVTHNYRREDDFNLWFTLTVPRKELLQQKLAEWRALPGVEKVLNLPALKLFKIGVRFSFSGAAAKQEHSRQNINFVHPTEQERAAIRALFSLNPLPRPYREAGGREGITEAQLLSTAETLLGRGALRRVAAVLRHRQAGFKANAMVAWIVPESRVEEVGPVMAQSPAASHVYLRPSYPEWPYNLYTMIHGTTADQCDRAAAEISRQTGVKDYRLLFSTKEYKKTSLRYFPRD